MANEQNIIQKWRNTHPPDIIPFLVGSCVGHEINYFKQIICINDLIPHRCWCGTTSKCAISQKESHWHKEQYLLHKDLEYCIVSHWLLLIATTHAKKVLVWLCHTKKGCHLFSRNVWYNIMHLIFTHKQKMCLSNF